MVTLQYCNTRFGHYGQFATLPLHTAVISTGTFSFNGFKSAFEQSGRNHSRNPQLATYLQNLTFHDSEFFTVEEIRLLLNVGGTICPVSDQQIELDLQELRREARRPNRIPKRYAAAIIKAITFWKLRFDDKYDEWLDEFVVASHSQIQRWDGPITAEEAPTGRSADDEGYASADDTNSNDGDDD
jgi:hypothetical protein